MPLNEDVIYRDDNQAGIQRALLCPWGELVTIAQKKSQDGSHTLAMD